MGFKALCKHQLLGQLHQDLYPLLALPPEQSRSRAGSRTPVKLGHPWFCRAGGSSVPCEGGTSVLNSYSPCKQPRMDFLQSGCGPGHIPLLLPPLPCTGNGEHTPASLSAERGYRWHWHTDQNAFDLFISADQSTNLSLISL